MLGFICPWAYWNLPGPEIKLVFPALAGEFSIFGPPGKSLISRFLKELFYPFLFDLQVFSTVYNYIEDFGNTMLCH